MSDDMIETINNTDEMGRSSSEEGEMNGEARPADTPEQIAHELAGSQSVAKRGRRAPSLTGYLPRQEALLRQAYRHFVEASESRRVLSYAAEWLLDNFYIVLQAIRQVREDMPRTYYAQLPRLDSSALAGYPRVYTIAHAIIASSEGYLDTTHALLFIRAYQDVSPLTMGELWALPTMLRIVFIESLARAIVQIAEIEPPAGAWPDIGPRDAVHSLTAEAIVVNSIMSLRTLATQDWKTFFESASPVEKILQSDPIDIYAQMDFATRDRYRKAVEQLARAAGQDELVVARTAIQLADSALHTKRVGLHTTQEAEAAPDKRLPKTQRVSWREAHVGFYLVGAGFARLEAELDYHPPFGKHMQRWLSKHAFSAYISVIFLFSVVLVLGALWYAHSAGGNALQLVVTGLLALLPSVAVAVDLTNRFATYLVPPRVLPRLDDERPVPPEHRAVVVVPAILNGVDQVDSLIHQLELHHLGNEDPHISFALLTDFPDAPARSMPDDDALYGKLKEGIETLNRKYPSEQHTFLLFHRDREWNSREDRWMGWERKRGKLVEFNRLLAGSRETSFRSDPQDIEALTHTAYVITLDADTVLPRDSARRLIATLAHPLNRAEFDPETGVVIAGYTVLQPRVEITPASANRSLFTHIFASDTGLDLYTRAVSDVYQDLFGEGVYVGKGIYDVAAFERSLSGRVPDNALLSHDLFEGIHGRAGLVTDIILFEQYPPNYITYARRLHRWVRGDWQLLPWLLPRVPHAGRGKIPNRLSALSRFKILDNLRRSLAQPALLALLLAGWFYLPGSALVWTLVSLGSTAISLLFSLLIGVWRQLRGIPFRETVPGLRPQLARWILAQAFLGYESLRMLDAIATTLVRLIITRKRMLQWTTFDHSIRLQVLGTGVNPVQIWRRSYPALLVTGVLALLILFLQPASIPVAGPILFLWLISPQLSESISRHLAPSQAAVSEADRQRLRRLACRTWLFFERFVGPEDHWLPPDHFQEDPRGLVAHRTSPTNIGLLLLSALTAYDMGYIGLMHLVLRLRDTLESMHQLERYRGHFVNWYDTLTLEPLLPRYVSTVDNGNLVACLIALKQGVLELSHKPLWRWERWQGLMDTLEILDETLENLNGPDLDEFVQPLHAHIHALCTQVLDGREHPEEWGNLLHTLNEAGWQELDRLLVQLVTSNSGAQKAGALHELSIWSDQVQLQLLNMQHEMEMLIPWQLPLRHPPALFVRDETPDTIRESWEALREALPATLQLGEVSEVTRAAQTHIETLLGQLSEDAGPSALVAEARAWCTNLTHDVGATRLTAMGLLVGFEQQSQQIETLIQEMDFRFLYDEHQQVFHLGYDVAAERLDGNHYDLLASEARIASLVAIARGDVPQSHWLHLARPISRIDGAHVLLSWNGSMFEYLMPNLLIRSPEGSLLQQISRSTVQRQIVYARQNGLPWGISEAGYYAFDGAMNYQYRGFGVPGLGFKRGLADDSVIAPYASFLALSLRPQAVLDNMTHLIDLGLLGSYGFYESVDFTPARLPLGQKQAIVRSYMAHHQGMIMLALANFLDSDEMVERFHRDTRIQSVELLLHEQASRQVSTELPHSEEIRSEYMAPTRTSLVPWHALPSSPLPQVHYLSNGRYGLLLTSDGGGYSQWKEHAVTRWRADTTLDDWGSWIYIQDRDSGDMWSAGYQPTGVNPDESDVRFNVHMVEYRIQYRGISLQTEVTVSPEDDVEIRHLTLTNHGDHIRRLSLTSYSEVVLATQMADARHPAFNRLFIEGEYIEEVNGLLFRRRPRAADDPPIYVIHALIPGREQTPTRIYETSRGRFLGRGRTMRSPAALENPTGSQQNAPRASLDPIMSLTQHLDLHPHTTAHVTFITLAAESKPQALDLARRYQSTYAIRRAFNQARTHSEEELHRLELRSEDVQHFQLLLSALLYPHPALRAEPSILAANRQGQPGLWPFAVSGDNPILLVHVDGSEGIEMVSELMQAHQYWRTRLILVDLVILNHQDTSYSQDLHDQLFRLIARSGGDTWLGRRGGIFLLRAHQMTEDDLLLLQAAARVILHGKKGRLTSQLEPLRQRPSRLPAFFPTRPRPKEMKPMPALERPGNLSFDNGYGGFSADGKEYVIYHRSDQWTPAPWVNVIANENFGFMISEAGGGFTWAGNSGENRLTPWRNDPVTDMPGETIYLRDEETGLVWSPTPLPAGDDSPYLVRHGAGYTTFEHHSQDIVQHLRLFAAPDAPVKIMHLRLQNRGNRTRRITATCYAEWVLGSIRESHQQYIIPQFDARHNILLARNPYNQEFARCVAFLTASKEPHAVSGSRAEFIGPGENYANPIGLRRVGLSGVVDAGPDPCAAFQVHLWLAPGETEEVYFLLGQGKDQDDAIRLVERFHKEVEVESAWEAVHTFWDRQLGSVKVKTPEPAMDLLLNRWLLYQSLSCRIWGRSALYQSSGAFGFRDQLQDVLALTHSAPQIARQQILRSARHQFEAGDVLHWWHPPAGRGVRTRCSDDLLWLPFVTAHYVSTTGDESLLHERVPFLVASPLTAGEHDRYGLFPSGSEMHTLYEHCLRAIQRGATRGAHGLPLMGGHDWNDGYSQVGAKGKGESIWLGWFLYATLTRFAGICERMQDSRHASEFGQRALELHQALEEHGWDGRWYLRAYYDDGTPMGSAERPECQIDSLAQSWAVLSGAAVPSRARQAMQSVDERLVQSDHQLIALFTPPFDKTDKDPGYVKGYAPGTRENGGQYTHGALWVIAAFAELGLGDRAEELFRMLNPIYHANDRKAAETYRVEPYVVAADVYSVPPYAGRGGWTWYTGSASWMFRVGLEWILGLRREGNSLHLAPCIPRHWPAYEISYRFGETPYSIHVENPEGVNRGVKAILLDGEPLPEARVLLVDDGKSHEVHVQMG